MVVEKALGNSAHLMAVSLDVTRRGAPEQAVKAAVAGFRGDPGGSSYSASKFAVEGLSESLASELAPLGVNVTIVEPGYFRTEFLTSGSAHFAANVLQDYDATAGHVRRLMKEYGGFFRGVVALSEDSTIRPRSRED